MRRILPQASFGLAMVLAICAPFQANAVETEIVDVKTVLTDVSADAPTLSSAVMENVAQIPSDGLGKNVLESTVGDVDISVPSDSSNPIVMQSTSGVSLNITLPFPETAANARSIVDGVVAYDHSNGSLSAPIVKDDGSIQIATIIEAAESPATYEYVLGLPANSHLEYASGGGLLVLDEDGNFLAGVLAPWAFDAKGAPVPTHFKITPFGFEQFVDHKGNSYSYPIVADPWLGIDLVQRTVWVGSVLQVYPTDWARISYTNIFKVSAGYAARWAGWDEVVQKTPGTKENTPSMRDQYYCHFDFVRFRAPNKASWNLDYGRPYVDYATLVLNDCNV